MVIPIKQYMVSTHRQTQTEPDTQQQQPRILLRTPPSNVHHRSPRATYAPRVLCWTRACFLVTLREPPCVRRSRNRFVCCVCDGANRFASMCDCFCILFLLWFYYQSPAPMLCFPVQLRIVWLRTENGVCRYFQDRSWVFEYRGLAALRPPRRFAMIGVPRSRVVDRIRSYIYLGGTLYVFQAKGVFLCMRVC